MDMDYESECVFWADMDKDVVNKQCLANSSRVRVKRMRLKRKDRKDVTK